MQESEVSFLGSDSESKSSLRVPGGKTQEKRQSTCKPQLNIDLSVCDAPRQRKMPVKGHPVTDRLLKG